MVNAVGIIGAGDRLEILVSVHDLGRPVEYGMPGSGKPRCASGVDDGLKLRFGANMELGDSDILYLYNENGPRNYQYIKSHDNYWILLEKHRDQLCYFARGDDAFVDTGVIQD